MSDRIEGALFFVPENPPEKAKKSKKLTITEKNPPKKPPHISEKVLFAPDCFSLCQSALAGLVGLWYNEGAVAGRTAARVFVKALDVVLCGSVKGFRLPLRRGAPL